MSKTQTTIEITIGFIVVLSLFFSIISIWVWANRQIANRQPIFNSDSGLGRKAAGQPNRTPGWAGGNKSLVWPVYNVEELTKEEVHF